VNRLPIQPISQEDQNRMMEQMYRLCGKQVQSYHKHRHMGSNSSVPVELAQELMESIEYTTGLVGGLYAHRNMEEALTLGQKVLESKLNKAKSMLELVKDTAPQWQTECRWEALRCLRHYLERYDHLHMAHKGPEDLFYPILISPPEGICGIDSCLFYLNILWIENQIMAGIPEAVLERFWDILPAEILNQCEPVLINGVGKLIINASLDQLSFEPEELVRLIAMLPQATESQLKGAARQLCQTLDLRDENACTYVEAVVPLLLLWIGENGNAENLYHLFV